MDDLIASVTAWLDEDEAMAGRGEEVLAAGWPDYQTFDSPELDDACKYLDRFGPARVLREVEAGRRILARHSPVRGSLQTYCTWCPESVSWPCPDIRDLAAIWNGHPDCPQERRP